MQTRDEVEDLHNCQEFSQTLLCLYQATQIPEKVFYCFYKLTSLRKNAKLFVMVTEKFSAVPKSCTRSLNFTRNQFLFCKKDAFQNTVFSRFKCQLKRETLTEHDFYRFSKFQLTREWVNKVNLSSFQIRACVISARKAKHLDVTTMFTYSHANTPVDQSERKYYLIPPGLLLTRLRV